MLEILDLHVEVDGKEILKGVSIKINKGETHVLVGPNASGKSTLALTILGYPVYKVTKGRIIFEGQDLGEKDIFERARLGVALAHQNPPEIRGVKLRDVIRLIAGKEPWNPLIEPEEKFAVQFLERVGFDRSFLARDINLGFSGGERKRSELAQVFAMKPKLMMLDEPDSGVDIDSLRLLGREINRAAEELKSSVLVITHHCHILRYLKPTQTHVMYDGKIVSSGRPDELIPRIEELGYEEYMRGYYHE